MFHQSFVQTSEVSSEEKFVQPLVMELNDEDLTQVNGSWWGWGWGWPSWGWGWGGWSGWGWGGWGGWGGCGCGGWW